MTATVSAMALGATLAISGLAFGFWGFLFVALLMAIGAVLGRAAEGRLDLGGVMNALLGKSSSS